MATKHTERRAVTDREGSARRHPAEVPPDTHSQGCRENEQETTGVAEEVATSGPLCPVGGNVK